MKIIIDECLPKRVTRFFEKDSAYTVPQIGLSGSKDTELLEELEIPVYLDKDIREILMKKLKEKGNEFSLNSIVNALIKQDIEISQKIAF